MQSELPRIAARTGHRSSNTAGISATPMLTPMNNEQTKTLGQFLWETHNPVSPWRNTSPQTRERVENTASAVISHVLQGAKYVLLEIGEEIRLGDEFYDYNRNLDFRWVRCPLGVIGDKIDETHFIHRRPISLPSSVRPEGKSEGPSTTPSASSGASGADVPAVYHKEHYDSSCPKCGGLVGAGMPHECPSTWQLPSPPAGMKWHREDEWREEWLTFGSRPLLNGEPLQLGDEVRHERPASEWGSVASLPWIAGLDEGKTGNYEPKSRFYLRTRRLLPQSGDPVVEEKPDDGFWKDKCQYLEGLRDRLTSERDQLRKELETAKQSLYETNESYEKAAHDRDAVVMDCRRLTTENAVLKERNKELAEEYEKSTESALRWRSEWNALRSQFRWTPISERLPTEKDTNKEGCVWIWDLDSPYKCSRPIRAIRWTNLYKDQNYFWITPISIPVAPPETEEQTMRREFEEVWSNRSDPRPGEEWVLDDIKAVAFYAYKVAKQSTKEKA